MRMLRTRPRCLRMDTRLLAAMHPLAATAGTPMPGKTDEPHSVRPGPATTDSASGHITMFGSSNAWVRGLCMLRDDF